MQFKKDKRSTILRKIAAICMTLVMVVTIVPATGADVHAAGALESVKFGYAYDTQRSPAYPVKGDTIDLNTLQFPTMAGGTAGTTNVGEWTLEKEGTYLEFKTNNTVSTSLAALLTKLDSKYATITADEMIIHELKNYDGHIAYGVVVAYDSTSGVAIFLGDSLPQSAGYVLSLDEKTANFSITAKVDVVAMAATYTVGVTSTTNGTTTVSATSAKAGDTVTITVAPAAGYEVASVKYNDGTTDHEVALTGGTYSFVMPASNVTVTATYTPVYVEKELEEMEFGFAYDVQRSPAYPVKGDTVKVWGFQAPYRADGTNTGSSVTGKWELTEVGLYSTIKGGTNDSRNLESLVNKIAGEYNVSADNILIHHLTDDGTHVAYGVTVAYDKAAGSAIFIGDSLNGAGYFLTITDPTTGSTNTEIEMEATESVIDWAAPEVPKTPETVTPETPVTPAEPAPEAPKAETPQTSDEFNLMLFGMAAMISMLAAGGAFMVRRKNEK